MTQKQISESILKRFVELRASRGYQLSYDWIKNHLKRKLKPNEVPLIALAIDDLLSCEYIKLDYHAETMLILTDAGFDAIYKVTPLKAVKQLRKEIMSRFKMQQSQPNHVLILNWLEQNLTHDFNPKEIELLPVAIEELAAMGQIQKETKNNFCIILTQQGFDSINYMDDLKKTG